MCGIFSIFKYKKEDTRESILKCSKTLRHRGPDWNGIYVNESNKVTICHERLSIVGVNKGAQPIYGENERYVLSVNGEIYNHKQIKLDKLNKKCDFNTDSDCEVILYLYREYGTDFLNFLDGVFSFVVYDSLNDKFLVGRDPIGVNPLYYSIDGESIIFSSELKAIREWSKTSEIKIFPPGCYMTEDRNIVKYYNPVWTREISIPKYNLEATDKEICDSVRNTLISSVEKRLMTDVPFGVLLSGGLDSSLTSSIASKLVKRGINEDWGNRIHSFSIGLKDAPDLKYARQVAQHLNTIHHEFNFTIEEGIDAIRDVIYHLETYDITTIRASIPMFLLSRKIKAMGIKMVLSGEGADEVYGGYLYFHKAPTEKIFHEECVKRVNNLHYFDCLRANKSTMAWGLEVRVPFLDKNFLDVSMPIRPSQKLRNIEKYILRKAFDPEMTGGEEYLPKEVLWRQKEQFSDGVGYNWVDSLIRKCNEEITDIQFKQAKYKYTYNIPQTKEAYYYREIFESYYSNCEKVSEYWIPNTDWEGVKSDPSGRAQNIHAVYEDNFK
mgnify:CR=1 FL=1|tara:strand:- start:1243 stop:2898 length:1656 start_codon:yes stop_codon:yes gene_type:complete